MSKIIRCFLPILLLSVSYVKAQTLSGKMFDSTNNKAVPYAVVAVLKPVDSILMKFIRTDKEGKFSLKNIPVGKYILMISHPVYADFVDDVDITTNNLDLQTVSFIPKSKLLQEVIIKSGSPIKIKGDTVSYTADSFKVSANANVEELLKKLPGIQVDKDGKIKAMGEEVKKVLVDGEEFFGDDPGMAVKNLRADAIKEVQVYDKKSDQAEFTGIDDGQKQKTINLKMKDDRKKGYFGKVDNAGGLLKKIDNRYNSNLMVHAFKGTRKLSAFLLNGNTGQDGLGWNDQDKYGGDNDNMSMDDEGGMMFFSRGGSSDDEPYINTENGFITNNNAGLHYSNKWNDKRTLTISPKYNRQLYNNRQTSFQQQQIGDSILNTNSTMNQHVNRYNFKNSLTYDWKIDSSNSLKMTLKANFYNSESSEETNSVTKSNTETFKNSTDRFFNQKSEKSAITATALFRHKFKKLRRTLSVNTDWTRLSTNGTNFLQSVNQSYFGGLPSFTQRQNQMIDIDKTTQKLTTKVVYTEPLNKKYALEIGYELSYSKGLNNQLTNSYSPGSGKFDDFIDSLSNKFDQLIVTNKPSAKISYNFKKIKFTFGSGFGFTKFDFKDLSFNKKYDRNFTNIFPTANFEYTYKANHSISFSYNGNTTQPTLNQLQPLRNNNDIFNQYIGNPDLKQSFTNSFYLRHNTYDFLKEFYTYQTLNVRSTINSIKNDRTISVDSGKTITKPINTNGDISINYWGGMGTKLKKLDIRINIGPSVNYSRYADVINGNISFSRTLSSGLGLNISKYKEKKYEVSIRNDFNYNRNTTSQNNMVNSFYTNELNVNGSLYYKKVWSITSDYNFIARQKTVQFRDNLTNHIWNARVQRTFKNNEFTAYAMIRDILNQNIGLERNYYGNSSSQVTNDRLRQYWMIGFTWDFKNKTAAAKTETK
jgi:hypothetical protein